MYIIFGGTAGACNGSIKKVPAFDKTKQIVFVGDEDSYVDSIKFVNVSSKAKVTNIKFSNPSVL